MREGCDEELNFEGKTESGVINGEVPFDVDRRVNQIANFDSVREGGSRFAR